MILVVSEFVLSCSGLLDQERTGVQQEGSEPNFFLRQVPPLQATGLAEAEEPVKGLRCAAMNGQQTPALDRTSRLRPLQEP